MTDHLPQLGTAAAAIMFCTNSNVSAAFGALNRLFNNISIRRAAFLAAGPAQPFTHGALQGLALPLFDILQPPDIFKAIPDRRDHRDQDNEFSETDTNI